MSLNEKRRHYQRGYVAGSHRAWPEHKPPLPPDEIVAEFVRAAIALRDAVDCELAKFGEDDELQETLGNPMDAVTESLICVAKWLKTEETPNAVGN